MKIAVYTIALNEEQFVQRWYESAKDADHLLIADTGSSDATLSLAKKFGINVQSISIKPWRFDDARNAALKLLPEDIDMCVSLDMDELLVEGWRDHLENIKSSTSRPMYRYTWNFIGEKPGLQFRGDRIHARHGYVWKHPVHEILIPQGIKEVHEWTDIEIHHRADSSKSRGQYFSLLKLGAEEEPNSPRAALYYGRELFFRNQLEDAAKELFRYLSLPGAVWKAERAMALRYLAKCEPHNALSYLERAVHEDPKRREPRVDLMQHYYSMENWNGLFTNAKVVLEELTENRVDYYREEKSWGALPYDLGALAAHRLGFREHALDWGKKALELEPDDERLVNNLRFYQAG